MPIEVRPFVALGFATTHEALAAEQALDIAGIDAVPIPSPKSFDALCGIAMRVAPDAESKALDALAQAGITPSRRADIEDKAHVD